MLIRQTLLYLPAQFLGPAAQLVSMLLWTWWLAPADMGAFVLISASQELAAMFSLSWFSGYALRYLPGMGPSGERQRFLDTETTVLLLSFIPLCLAALLCVSAFDTGTGSWTEVAVIASLFITRGANGHYAERARAQGSIVAYTILQIGGPLGGMVMGIVALEFFGSSVIVLIGAYAVTQMLANLAAVPLIGISLRLRAPDRATLKAAIGYGGPMLGLNAIAWAAENNVRYVVEHVAGTAAFGLLAVGWGLGRRAASVAAMLVAAAAFPIASKLLSEGNRPAALEQLKMNAALLFAVLVPTVVGLELIGDLLIKLAVAETYQETTKAVLSLAALAGAIRFVHIHTSDQLFVLERCFGYAAAVGIVEIAATIVLAVIGLEMWGLVGAVAGAVAASTIAAALSLFLAIHRLGFQFPLLDLLRVSIAAALMAGGLLAIPLPETVIGLVLKVALGMAIYGLAMAMLYWSFLAPRLRKSAAAA